MKTTNILLFLVTLVALSGNGFSQQTIDYNKHYDYQGTVTGPDGKPHTAQLKFSVPAGSPHAIVRVRKAIFGKIQFRSAIWDQLTNEVVLYDNDDFIPGGNASFNHVLRLKIYPFSAKGILNVYRFRNADGYGSLYPAGEPNEASQVELQLSKNNYIPRKLNDDR